MQLGFGAKHVVVVVMEVGACEFGNYGAKPEEAKPGSASELWRSSLRLVL